MTDPNPKRAKMDDPDGGSSSSSTKPDDRTILSKGKLIDPNTQDFNLIRNMPGFVDHTHFIRGFLLRGAPKLAIFAPRRFGKSSHLDMVKKFLQIDVDETTGEVLSSVNGPAKGRKNYKVFEGTRIITDRNNKYLVADHLGKHPVIHLDFKEASIDSVEEAKMHCRKVVHQAYLEHPYLKTSTKLTPGDEEANATDQLICEEWCDNERYKMQDLDDVLENLIEFLYNHFDKAKVYILVDEFDAMNTSALFEARGETTDETIEKLENICSILTKMFGSVIKGNDLVAGALITGVLHVSMCSNNLNNLNIMKFLDGTKVLQEDQDFVPFYGATKEEVRNLIERLVQDKELMKFEGQEEFCNGTGELDVDKIMADVQSRYNGYFDENGTRIFCLFSVLNYLQSGDAINYWNETNRIVDLYMILKSGEVACAIMKLMRWETIDFERCHRFRKEDLVNLHDFIAVEKQDRAHPKVVLNFLMDQGYLSYPEEGPRDKKFKLPNSEIRAALSKMIGDIVQTFWKMSTTSCTRLIDEISLSLMKNENLLKEQMLLVYNAISEILRPLEQKNRGLSSESRMLCTMYKILDDANSFELGVDLPIKDAEGNFITSERPDFLQLHKNDEKCSILWELKFNKNGRKEMTSLYALQEARGKVAYSIGKTKEYMKLLKDLGREALVIGLSMDGDMKLSLSYSLDMEEKIYFVSEREHILYPALYETHKAEPLPKE